MHSRSRTPDTPSDQDGWTLVEIGIVALIVAILATIVTMVYGTSLRNTKLAKAVSELHTISSAVMSYIAKHGESPKSLAEVGHLGRLDPWGRPYMYLNFHTGTGSGMQFVAENGLIDPDKIYDLEGPGGPVPKGQAHGFWKKQDRPPMTPTQVNDVRRKDRLLFPLNSDFDLFSLGPNGKAFSSVGHDFSLDDVIRANDGHYFGPASDY